MGVLKWWDISGTPQIKDNSVLTFVDSNAKTLQRLPRNLLTLTSEQMLRRCADSDGKPEYLKRQRRCMLRQVRGLEAELPKLAFYPTKARPHPIAGFAIEGHREE